ncbi:MAG TPA: NAD-dependent epimerase/dehydratase family protein [Rhodopila sp.]
MTAGRFGFVEWFRPGEHERVSTAIAGMRAAGASSVRTHLSWATYHTPEGAAWYDWLIPALSRDFELLPCVHYTPPSLSRTGRSSGPPRRLKDFPDFVDHVLTRYGAHFSHIELWNEPNNLLDWDWREDPDWLQFCEMIGAAAHWTRHRGWKPVLGGPCPFDPNWLELMGQRGILGTVSAVGFHAFPGTWDSEAGGWLGYETHLADMRSVLDRHNPAAEIWITEAGYSTWRNDEAAQVEHFQEALAAPADRLYWYGWQDIPHSVPVQEGLYFDPRHYHLGVTDVTGRPKMLRRQLEACGGPAPTRSAAISMPRIVRDTAPVAIFGGAGFIGANLADALMRDGEDVIVFDNLSRPGVERNLNWLTARQGGHLNFVAGDIRDPAAVAAVIKDARAVFHLAAQVAVTSSLIDPVEDFSVNLQGTLNILESIRQLSPATPLVFASTNKVYGALPDVGLEEAADRYIPLTERLRVRGVDEARPLEFCTPYGCSKGAADQYVLDYAHSFGLRTAVLRKSCIYGPRQFGTEDQGWVAHFVIRALRDEPIVIYGDGKQVRDVLHVTDAVAAYRSVLTHMDTVAGQAFNLGGGVDNAVSLRNVLAEIEAIVGRGVRVEYAETRTGDQRYFVADAGKLAEATGWKPTIGWRSGIRDLADWLSADLGLAAVKVRRAKRSIPA